MRIVFVKRKTKNVFFAEHGQGGFVAKLQPGVGDFENNRVGSQNTLADFLIVGILIRGREGNVGFGGADNSTSFFDGIDDQIVIPLVLGFALVGAGEKNVHTYICISEIWKNTR